MPLNPPVSGSAALRLLLTDDNPLFLASTATLLAGAQWIEMVGQVANGTECLRLASQHAPDVVVLDLAMPDMNGFEVTKRLKALPAPPRVVILSLYDEPEYRQRARQSGADGYVAKAAAITELLPLLHSLFAKERPPHERSF